MVIQSRNITHRTRMKTRHAIVYIIMAISTLSAPVAQAYKSRPTQQDTMDILLAKGYDFNDHLGQPDSAFYYFDHVASTYHPDMTSREKERCVRALLGEWVVLVSSYYDYPRAFEVLSLAETICDEANLTVPRIDVSMAGMYQTLGDDSGNLDLMEKALDYYEKGLKACSDPKDWLSADIAFTNVLHVASVICDSNRIKEIWQLYSKLPDDEHNLRRTFNHTIYHTIIEGQRDSLLTPSLTTRTALRQIPDRPEYLRMKTLGYLFAALASQKEGDILTTIETYNEALDYASAHGISDAVCEIYGYLSDIYAKSGDQTKAKEAHLRALEIKDSLSFNAKYLKVGEMRFIGSLNRAKADMERMKAEKTVQNVWLLALSAIFVITCVFLLMIYQKNKRLQSQMKALYRHSVSALATDNHISYKQDNATYISENLGNAADGNTKYQGSSLKHSNLEELGNRINEYMHTSEAIFNLDFSVGKLAEALNSNQKYVSQTINELFGCNFNAYVNRYRVREACRRIITDNSWHNLTIEAIANEVGFKSRSSFINAFKKETGLTPSEFKRQSEIDRTN